MGNSNSEANRQENKPKGAFAHENKPNWELARENSKLKKDLEE